VLFSLKNKEILPFAATWIDSEDIIVSEISQALKDKCSSFSHVESKKVSFIEAENRMVVARDFGWRDVIQRVQSFS
jgi:hypothetical protein